MDSHLGLGVDVYFLKIDDVRFRSQVLQEFISPTALCEMLLLHSSDLAIRVVVITEDQCIGRTGLNAGG